MTKGKIEAPGFSAEVALAPTRAEIAFAAEQRQ